MNNFRLALRLVKENKKIIYYVLITFILFIIYGFLQPDLLGDLKKQIIDSITSEAKDKGFLGIFYFILSTNIKTSFLSILLGITLLPVLILLFNSYFIGSVMSLAVAKTNYLVLFRLFPHGIFEIPAVCISIAFGIKVGLCLFHKNRWHSIKRSYKEAFIVFFYIIVPLLLIAGTIESILYFLLI